MSGDVEFGPFRIPAGVDVLFRDDEVVPLEPLPVRVLRYLAGRVVTKQELLDRIWPDAFTTEGVLKKTVSQVRRAVLDDPAAPRYLWTHHRCGYRFIAPVLRRGEHQQGGQEEASRTVAA
jgi:DNA-binding winged helix-turn-helix (wHTH) protein